MANPFVHLELNTPDASKAKEFYGKLFNWTFTDHKMGGDMIYSVFKPGSGPGGGVMSMPGFSTQWLAYVGVEDIHAASQQARSLGATILREAQEVPNEGWFTVLKDPTGAMVALWQQKTQ